MADEPQVSGDTVSPLDDPRILAAIAEVFLRDADDGLIVADVESQHFLGMNDAYCRMVGCSREEMIGRTPFELGIFPYPEELERFLASAGGSFEPVWGEVHIRHANGEIGLTDALIRFVEVGGRMVVLGLSKDITERRLTEEALRESEAAARTLFQQNPIPMWVWDPVRLVPLDVNGAALEQYGYTRDEFLSMSLLDLRPEDEHERFRRTVTEASTGPDDLAYFGRWRHLRKDRSELITDVWSRVISRGERAARISIAIDVTERVRAEAALKDAEQRYRHLVESIPACVSLERVRDQKVAYAGPLVEEMLGYPLQDWYSGAVSWRSILHPDDRERVLAVSAELDERPERYSDEYRVLASDGRTLWVRDESVPLFDESDRLESWLGFWVDVTAQKEAELALRETEERYRMLVEAQPAVVWLEHIDPPGTDYISPLVVEMFGFPLEAWYANTLLWRDLIHPEDKDQLLADYREFVEHPRPYVREFRMLAKDGRTVWIRDQAAPIADEKGVFGRWQGFWTDITEQREAEAALRQAEEAAEAEQRHSEEERRELLARLVAAGEAERRRIAEDLHDAPIQSLTALQLRLESLRSHVDEQGRELIDKSLDAVNKSIHSLRAMMFDLQPRTLERDGLESAIRAHLTTLREDSGMEVVIRSTMDEDPPEEARVILYRIAQEALTNARKHSQARCVEVTIEHSRGGFQIRVEDDGIGFDPGINAVPGHIGLSAMRDRAELAGGSLSVGPGKAGGTSVVAWVPEGGDQVEEDSVDS